MLWADRIVEEITKTRKPRDGNIYVVRDEKTLSGRVHVGSMRSVAVHGLVAEVLAEKGCTSVFKYEYNDFDPFDSIPSSVSSELYKEHLGKPLYAVPSPEPGFANYAEYFADDFLQAHKKAGFTPEYYRATELYRSGKMDPYVKVALEKAADIRRILKEVSGSEKDESWLPISVICEQCGKMMTTRAYDFDGETIGYSCDKNPDDIQSCGHSGRLAPWKGNAKLFWKTDWAAKWLAVGVDVEGGGKDHSTRGGSRDVANHICREVFGKEPPFDTPYEFFLVGGKKMASSKGLGAMAKEMADLFPSELFRLVLIGKDIREQIDIDPSGESVPRLYDWYDELAENVRQGKADDYSRLYALCQLPENQAGFTTPWQMRFREVAFIVQMPHLDLEKEAALVKGSELTADDTAALMVRAEYAKFWLQTYAPAEFKYELQKEMPAVELSEVQKKALASLADYLQTPRSGEELHARLHELKTEVPIKPQELFQAIYRIFLNRGSGPKAGWFLAGLPHEFVVKRLTEAKI
jgi:lysyl-tRNA synthetase, class I